MDIICSCLAIIIFSYLLGSVPGALVVGKIFTKKDFRQEGSGNIGATNALRIIGKEKGKLWGCVAFLMVFFLDAGKAVAAAIFASLLIPDLALAYTLAVLFTVLGHNYSIFLGFRGGRGAASLLGFLLFFSPLAFASWFGTFVFTAVVFEMLETKKIDKKIIPRAVDRQIIGRLFGEVFALIPVFFINQDLFWPTLAVTPLIILRHKSRVKRQLKEMKEAGRRFF